MVRLRLPPPPLHEEEALLCTSSMRFALILRIKPPKMRVVFTSEVAAQSHLRFAPGRLPS